MVFLASSRWMGPSLALPAVAIGEDWEGVADQLTLPLHRAALMLAVGRQHTSSGQRNRGAKSLTELLPAMAAMMAEDLVLPLVVQGTIVQGDARNLSMLADESVSGIVTSPPYLSRYDYRETNSAYETVYRHWYPQTPVESAGQVQASPATTSTQGRIERRGDDDVLAEIQTCLGAAGPGRAGAMVRNYFSDLRRVLCECHRVLSAGGVCWMVVGGSRIKDVYVPSDLMISELAQSIGLEVGALRVARDLVRPRRKFGRIGYLSPRETVLVMVKP